MKYAFLNIKIISGEYEFSSMGVHEMPNGTNLDEFALDYLSDFYGSPDEPETELEIEEAKDHHSNYRSFNGGEVAARVKEVREITEEEYNVLSKFI